MTTITLKLSPGDGIRWPQECAVCGAPASGEVRASCSVARNLKYMAIVLEWTRHSVSLTYPVCSRHYIFASLMGLITRRSLINLGLGVLIASYLVLVGLVPLALLIVDGTSPKNATQTIVAALIAAPTLALFIWTQRHVPVKLEDVTNERLRLRIARQAYAAAFLRLNQSMVSDSET